MAGPDAPTTERRELFWLFREIVKWVGRIGLTAVGGVFVWLSLNAIAGQDTQLSIGVTVTASLSLVGGGAATIKILSQRSEIRRLRSENQLLQGMLETERERARQLPGTPHRPRSLPPTRRNNP